MKTVKYEVAFDGKASRLELFIRWFWAIPTYIVYIIQAIIGLIAMFLQWFHILFLGKRNEMLFNLSRMLVTYLVKFISYFYLLTDERNPLLPEEK